MELKEGIYVRTHKGIARIIERPNISVVVWNDRKVIYVDMHGYPVATSLNCFVFEDEITNASFNPVDLIEVGDYVNGYKVLFIDKDLGNTKNIKCIDNSEERACFYEEDIKDIVTKEQFNSCKYVVERDK